MKKLLVVPVLLLVFVVVSCGSVQRTVQEILSQSLSSMANKSSCALSIDIQNQRIYCM